MSLGGLSTAPVAKDGLAAFGIATSAVNCPRQARAQAETPALPYGMMAILIPSRAHAKSSAFW